MAARLITAIFTTRCAKCRQTITEGTRAWYDKAQPKGYRTTHETCGQQQAPTPAQAPRSTVQQPAASANVGPIWRVDHASVQDFLAYETIAKPTHPIHETRRADEHDDWCFGLAHNKTTLDEWLRHGWPEGAKRLAELRTDVLNAPRSIKRARVRSDQGDTLDIHAVYRSDLQHAWERTQREPRAAPRVVRLVPVVTGVNQQEPEQFFWRGAAIAKLADLLTEAGYAVEVQAAVISPKACEQRDRTGWQAGHTVMLKQSTAPLDLSNLAAFIGNTGTLRWYHFGHLAFAPFRPYKGCGLYDDKQLPDDIAQAMFADSQDAPTFIASYQIGDKETAEQWIAKCVRTLEKV